MNIKELSEYMGTPKSSIYTMVCLRKIPQACIVKIGRSLRFETVEIEKWITTKRISPGSAPTYK